jgi:hypothetical protein
MNKDSSDTLVAIKHGDDSSGLDTLFDYNANDVENKSTIEVVGSGNIRNALKEYEEMRRLNSHERDYLRSKSVLTSSEINVLIQFISKYDCPEEFAYSNGGFISDIIQNSYDVGENNFYFNLEGIPSIYSLCSNLTGKDERPIDITVKGNTSFLFAESSKYLNMFVDGYCAKAFAHAAKNCTLVVKGFVHELFAAPSRYLTAIIDGNVDVNAFARNSVNFDGYISHDVSNLEIESTAKILQGKNAREHPEYKRMMKEWERRFK